MSQKAKNPRIIEVEYKQKAKNIQSYMEFQLYMYVTLV